MSSSLPPRTKPPDASINVAGDVVQGEVKVDESGTVSQREPPTACSPSAQLQGPFVRVNGQIWQPQGIPMDALQLQGQVTAVFTTLPAAQQQQEEEAELTTDMATARRIKKCQLKKRPDKIDNDDSPAQGDADAPQASRSFVEASARPASEGDTDAQHQLLSSPPALTDRDQPPIDEAVEAKNWRDEVYALKVPESALPENSTRVLKFPTRQAAHEASSQRGNTWSSPSADPTMPATDEERAKYVLRLVLAVESPVDIKNKRNHRKQWENLDATYSRDAIEKVCHDVVYLAELLHTRGISSFSIYDRKLLKKIEKTSAWTFEERMQHLIKLLCFWKNKCVTLMKGSGLEEFVAMPLEKMEGGLQNAKHNDNRQRTLAAGRAVREKGQDVGATLDAQDGQGNKNTMGGRDKVKATADEPAANFPAEESTVAHHDTTDGLSSDITVENVPDEDAESAPEDSHAPACNPPTLSRKRGGDQPHPAAAAGKRVQSVSEE